MAISCNFDLATFNPKLFRFVELIPSNPSLAALSSLGHPPSSVGPSLQFRGATWHTITSPVDTNHPQMVEILLRPWFEENERINKCAYSHNI